jgi:hypothetical protein
VVDGSRGENLAEVDGLRALGAHVLSAAAACNEEEEERINCCYICSRRFFVTPHNDVIVGAAGVVGVDRDSPERKSTISRENGELIGISQDFQGNIVLINQRI